MCICVPVVLGVSQGTYHLHVELWTIDIDSLGQFCYNSYPSVFLSFVFPLIIPQDMVIEFVYCNPAGILSWGWRLQKKVLVIPLHLLNYHTLCMHFIVALRLMNWMWYQSKLICTLNKMYLWPCVASKFRYCILHARSFFFKALFF